MDDLDRRYEAQCSALRVKPDPAVGDLFHNKSRTSVRNLDFSSKYPGGPGLNAILETLRDCTNLSTLNLSNTYIKSPSIPRLIEVVQTLPNLTSLDLSQNPAIAFNDVRPLVNLVKSSPKLLELDLTGTSINPVTLSLIDKYLEDNAARSIKGNDTRQGYEPSDTKPLPVGTGHGYSPTAPAAPPADSYYNNDRPMVHQPLRSSGTKAAPPPDPLVGDGTHTRGVPRHGAPVHGCEKLKMDIINHEDTLLRTITEFPPGVDTRKQETILRLQTGSNIIADYFECEQTINHSNFGEGDLVSECKLLSTDERISDLRSQYVRSPGQEPDDVVCALVQGVMQDPQGRKMTVQNMEDTTCCLDQDICSGMRRLNHIVVTNPVTTQSVLADLFSTDETLRQLLAKITTAEQLRAQSIDDEDMHKAEFHHDESIKLQSQLMKLMKDRLATVTSPGNNLQLLTTVDEDCDRIRSRLGERKKHVNDSLAGLAEDTEKLDKARTARVSEFNDVVDNFKRNELRTSQDLHANAQRQQQVWTSILDQYEQLKKLAEQRRDAVDRYIADREEFEVRKGDHQQWMDVALKKQASMENLQNVLPHHLDLYHNIELAIAKLAKIIGDRIDVVRAEVHDKLDEERLKYLDYFRRFYLTIGELLYKKDERVTEIDAMIDQNQYQLDMVRESLDPNSQIYRSQIMELTRLKEDVANKVEYLKELGDEAEEDFEPVEQALLAQGHKFTPPTIELQEQNVQRRTRIVGARKDFVAKKSEKVNMEDDEVHALENTTRQAKSTGLSTLISPLSPHSPRAQRLQNDTTGGSGMQYQRPVSTGSNSARTPRTGIVN